MSTISVCKGSLTAISQNGITVRSDQSESSGKVCCAANAGNGGDGGDGELHFDLIGVIEIVLNVRIIRAMVS